MKQRNQAFTLIELLVVIAIIGVLIALIAPAIASTRERAHMAECMSNMRQLALSAMMYSDDHNGRIPDISTTDLGSYVEDEGVFYCPRDKQEDNLSNPSYTACKYTPDSLLMSDYETSRAAHKPEFRSEIVLYIESDLTTEEQARANIGTDALEYDRRHDGRTVIVFADGHVSSWSFADVQAFLGTGIPGPRD
jgi:prepilin-type N-terminal cleavage/methylation domain-containing protein/prepilin-type processing-associated H-X9-DG protein